ncbi:hypothetical protein [Candidatus Frankia nodulisporulans]|uniref:hypothetical protein n=1 Tax=Candidatus Frankia nodulisporulans TaxID=2060052 RepID=UPI00158289D4|nr:hypothetical protein [Candidatus Frankia nodulisporulans]
MTRTRRVAVPVLPRDWDALAVRGVVGLVLALTLVSITWSTVSIAHLLDGTWTAYLAGGVFDLAWCAALGMAYLVRFRPDRRTVVDRVGWALLAVTVTAIGIEGHRTGGLAMACIGASVSIAAKALWWTFGHATRPELTADDAQWVAAQISAASAQLAVASVRRQVARAQDRAAAELLAMEASRRPPHGTVNVHATPSIPAAPAAIPAPDMLPAPAVTTAPEMALRLPEKTLVAALDAPDRAAERTAPDQPKQLSPGRPGARPNRGVTVPPAARDTTAPTRSDSDLLDALDALGEAAGGLSIRAAATHLCVGQVRAKRLLTEHAARRQAPLSLVHDGDREVSA